MKRRQFITKSAVLTGTGLASISIAKASSNPKVKWRMTASFPKNLDLLFGTSQLLVKFIISTLLFTVPFTHEFCHKIFGII